MKIIVGGWFTLPRLGRDVFSGLMKLGVKYDKELGFRIDSWTDIERAVRAISTAVGEEVEVSLRCFVCLREACPGCPYLEVCDRRKVSPLCLCSDHSSKSDAFEIYQDTFSKTFS